VQGTVVVVVEPDPVAVVVVVEVWQTLEVDFVDDGAARWVCVSGWATM
jgi:hypothetical protein